ncbi:efflux RND transporter periplasmic adaptor subunit [Planctomicrobium sp. SH668]|uniref:efflux RND transporter periplasmic adaptor subunit n=1 Tax=Planctomicrobium sp. SH668 TaxID=3448126 RepID=UPI003F5B3D1C
MSTSTPTRRSRVAGLALAVVAISLIIPAAITSQRWLPGVMQRLGIATEKGKSEPAEHDDHDHGPDDPNSLELSTQARKNLGLDATTVQAIQPSNFLRTIAVPAVIVPRPGRTIIEVSTPLTGVVQHVHAVTGEAVDTNSLLFDIRLTHEDLVQTQSVFLQTLGELDVEKREIKRLESIADSGAIAGKTLLERHYAHEKLAAMLAAQREALKLHGLSSRQIEEIEKSRTLLRELHINAPSVDEQAGTEELQLTADILQPVNVQSSDNFGGNQAPALTIEQLFATKGQSVTAGDRLCTLANYDRLFIEGQAFEQDLAAINRTIASNWPLTALFDDGSQKREVADLKLAYVSNSIDPNSRSLSFFVDLPNELISNTVNDKNQRFISWKYRVGQRLQLLVPVEEWKNEFVLPVDAVVREAAESFVFVKNGAKFTRTSVHVKYRDQRFVVVANDGSIQPRQLVVMKSAHQLQIALKNKAGGGVDPHAGHNH